MIFIIVYILCTLFLLAFKSKRNLHMLQQNLYNENNRYLKWISKNIDQFFEIDLLILVLSLIGYLFLYNNSKYSNILLVIMAILVIVLSISIRNRIINDQNKKPLVITSRVKRIICTNTILYLIPLIILFINFSNNRLVWLSIFIYTIMIYLNNFVVYIATIINLPIEALITMKYRNSAINKMNNINGLKVIGITGSYGKTSSKNILNNILNVKYNTFASPRNLNTPKGLMTTINNDMDKFTEIFIAEMGAYKRGEVKELCDFVHPKYGIITRIGTAHLETFGSQENIQKGKMELIESLPKDGFGVLNKDDPLQVSYKLKNNIRIIWIGIDEKDVDVRATNIKCSDKGTSFDVLFKDDNNKYHFETKLLGKHNVYNILAGLACGIEFNIPIKDLQDAIKGLKPVEHRLELKKLGNFYQIDDAYNSNPVGAKNALDVLDMMPGIKVVVTPGMIELGDKEYELNKEFGRQISKVADYVVLVGEKQTEPIKKGLEEEKFDKDKIIVLNDVRKAYTFIMGLVDNKDVYALFENDLPDTYNE